MVFKINIAEKSGKTFKLESDSQALVGKKLYDKFNGEELSGDLKGYEFEITGASDKSGFPSLERVEGTQLKRVLLSYEKGMHKRPKKEGKRKRSDNTPKGLRLRKTVRGNTISESMVQINLKLVKEGSKKLAEVFPEQNKAPEATEEKVETPVETTEEVKEETQVEEKLAEEKKE
ncbi:MAG: S6e family ribosomal protein [Candidatus Pacearchaeota archaeon]